MKRIIPVVLLVFFGAFTLSAQVVVKGDVDIRDKDGTKLQLTDTIANKSWELVSGLYNGFQIGYLTGNLTGTSAPFHITESGLVRIGTATIDNNAAMTIGGDLTLRGNLKLDTGFGIKVDNAPFISRIGSSLVIGVSAGNSAMTGGSNVFVGGLSGQSNTTGNRNAYFGEGAGSANTTGYRNVYIGALSGNSSVLGAENTFMGFQSGYESEGSRNTFLGAMSGRFSVDGTENTAVGFGAGSKNDNTTGQNTFLGAYAGEHGENGTRNVAVGFRAGSDVDGTRNVLLGYQAGSGDSFASNSLYIANNTYDAPGGALIYGRFDQGKVGINTRNLEANSALTVAGEVTATKYNIAGGGDLVSSQWANSNSDIAFNGGNVGIGTNSPISKLHVNGGVYLPLSKSMGYDPEGDTFSYDGDNVGHYALGWYSVPGSAEARLSGYGGIRFFTGSTLRFSILSTGAVGIGISNPSEMLEVDGNALFHGDIEATKLRVTSTPGQGWPDYVFEPEFRLRPLSEVEAFVKDNKHLPEVPSAKEVEEKGIDLGNMDATLLKKVEEVTLYLIEMNKKIEKLEEENKKLRELLKKDK